MKNKIYKLIMKHPIPTISTALALFVPFYVAITFYQSSRFYSLGIFGIVVSSLILHSLAICLWWLISYLSNDLWYKVKNKKNHLESEYQTEKWKYNIVSGSVYSLIVAFGSLGLCYLFDWSFKMFLMLVYIIPLSRLLSLFFGWIYLIKKDKI